MPRKTNPFGKKTELDKPYAVYKNGDWEMRVLKTYRHPDNEGNQYDRWFIAAKSPLTYGSWEYGDTYREEILENFYLANSTDEWFSYYVENAL